MPHQVPDNDCCKATPSPFYPSGYRSPATSVLTRYGVSDGVIQSGSPEADTDDRQRLSTTECLIKASVTGSVHRQFMAASGMPSRAVPSSLVMVAPFDVGFKRVPCESASASSSTQSSINGGCSPENDECIGDDASSVVTGSGRLVSGSAVVHCRRIPNQSAGNAMLA